MLQFFFYLCFCLFKASWCCWNRVIVKVYLVSSEILDIYLDHQLVATIPGDAENYSLDCDISKLHEYSITAVYSNGVESEAVSITEDATGISSVSADGKKNTVFFNIAGQRVNNNAKGFIIKKGKKMLVK